MDTTTVTGTFQHASDALGASCQALSPACKAFVDTFKVEYEKGMRARLEARCAAAGLKVVDDPQAEHADAHYAAAGA